MVRFSSIEGSLDEEVLITVAELVQFYQVIIWDDLCKSQNVVLLASRQKSAGAINIPAPGDKRPRQTLERCCN